MINGKSDRARFGPFKANLDTHVLWKDGPPLKTNGAAFFATQMGPHFGLAWENRMQLHRAHREAYPSHEEPLTTGSARRAASHILRTVAERCLRSKSNKV